MLALVTQIGVIRDAGSVMLESDEAGHEKVTRYTGQDGKPGEGKPSEAPAGASSPSGQKD